MEKGFFGGDVVDVAESVIGCYLLKDGLKGLIVEAEAYRGSDDPASHAYNGMTERNKVMFGSPGKAYIYVSYGIHYMLNVVAEEEDRPAAVLIRAVKPLEGIDIMRDRRSVDKVEKLCNGPGKLTEAFKIDESYNGTDLTSGNFKIIEGEDLEVERSKRIGISEGKEKDWRFTAKNMEKFLSR